jgi:dCMP deaminase
MPRLSKEQYYLNIAKQVAQRSTCFRMKFGAIIVKDDQIISTGYVGAPRKTKDCFERGNCLRDELKIPHGQRYELCRSVHAEQNAIINAARAGVSLLGGNMFLYGENEKQEATNAFPCFICKKMLINAGLDKIICSINNNDFRIFDVQDWANDWREKDIIDDKDQYGKN